MKDGLWKKDQQNKSFPIRSRNERSSLLVKSSEGIGHGVTEVVFVCSLLCENEK